MIGRPICRQKGFFYRVGKTACPGSRPQNIRDFDLRGPRW